MRKVRQLGLAAVAILGTGCLAFFAWPNECDNSVNREFDFAAWASNILKRATGREQNCDPWDRVKAKRSIGPIAIVSDINGYAGPSLTQFYIQPNGQGFVMPIGMLQPSPYESASEALSGISNEVDGAFQFSDLTLYEKVSRLIAPLREYTGCMSLDDGPRCHLPPGAEEKIVIECPVRYHGSFTIYWTGSFNSDTDVSHFASGGSDVCLPLRAATNRLSEATHAMQLNYPKAWEEEWAKQETAKKQR